METGQSNTGPAALHRGKNWTRLFLLFSSAFLWTILPQHAYGVIPQEPETFKNKWEEVANPLLLWTFRQSDCLSGTIPDDLDFGVGLFRDADSACPANGTFANAVVGATSTSQTARNTIKSGAVGTTFNSITTPTNTAPFRAMSFVLWFTPMEGNFTDGNKYILLEIGEETGATPAFDVGDNQLQIFIQTSAGASSDRLFAQVLLNTHEDAAFPILRSCISGSFIEPIRSAAGVRHFLALTLAYDGANLVIGSYLGAAGGTLETCIGVQGVSQSFSGEQPKSFGFQPDSVIRVGSSRTSGNGGFGFPATYHLVGIYDRGLSAVEVNKLYVAGLPNSVPVLANGGEQVIFTEDQENARIPLDSLTFLDSDGDSLTAIKILTLPAVGELRNNGNPVAIGDTVLVSDEFTYTFPAETFSVADPTCVKFASNVNEFRYADFQFVVTDGKGDGTVSCAASPLDASCVSLQPGRITICVAEANDDPIVDVTGDTSVVFADGDNPQAFEISCRDTDEGTASFGLTKIRITSQSQASLGTIHVTAAGTGACTGGIDFSTADPEATVINTSPGQNVTSTVSLCYQGAASPVGGGGFIGTDVISFECEDADGATATGTVILDVYNPLLAGCGDPATEGFQQTPCATQMLEDVSINISLRATDLDPSHTNDKRLYKLNTVPSDGKLFVPGSTSFLTADSELPADADGSLELTFVPDTDFFNAICFLNQDPVEPNCTTPLLKDAFNNFIVPGGVPINFNFSLGYDEDGAGSEPARFGPPVRFDITVLGVNDPPTNFTGPSEVIMPTRSTLYSLADLNDTAFGYDDPDGNTMRLGFVMTVDDSLAFISFPGLELVTGELDARITWLGDRQCLVSPRAGCEFFGKAYKADLMTLLQSIALTQDRTEAHVLTSALRITVWDPPPSPGSMVALLFDRNIPSSANISIALSIGDDIADEIDEDGNSASGALVSTWLAIGVTLATLVLNILG